MLGIFLRTANCRIRSAPLHFNRTEPELVYRCQKIPFQFHGYALSFATGGVSGSFSQARPTSRFM
jgi:hypothetical protein